MVSVVPVIREVPKVVTIIKKKTIVIECRVMSVFEPKCIWMKEKTAVREDSRHSVKIEEVKEVRVIMYLYNFTTTNVKYFITLTLNRIQK